MLAVLCGFSSYAQENYVVHLNGVDHPVSLDSVYHFRIHGRDITLGVSLKDTLTYKDSVITFSYAKGFAVSRIKTVDGVEQVSIVNSEGSGFLIQEYSTIDPSTLNEAMLQQAIKEDISYGYQAKRSDYSRELADGHRINVVKDTLTYKGDTSVFEVGSIGKKDGGVLIITMQDNINDFPQEKQMIDLLWDSLKIKI